MAITGYRWDRERVHATDRDPNHPNYWIRRAVFIKHGSITALERSVEQGIVTSASITYRESVGKTVLLLVKLMNGDEIKLYADNPNLIWRK